MPNKQSTKTILSQNLVTLRKLHQLTQDDVSSILRITRAAYSNYETSKRQPDLDFMRSICSLYHITIEELTNHNIEADISGMNRCRNIAMDISSANTLYLTSDETYLVMKYRDMDKEKRSSLRNFADSL